MSTDPVLAAITALGARFDRLEGRLDRLEARFDRLEGEVSRLRGDMVQKFEAIEDKLNLIRDDMTVAMGSANTAFERTQAARREADSIGGMVHTMARQIQRLRTDVDDLRAKGQAT